MRRLNALLRRLGLLAYEPYVCGLCGYQVPEVGSRRDQALQAWLHFDAVHPLEANA